MSSTATYEEGQRGRKQERSFDPAVPSEPGSTTGAFGVAENGTDKPRKRKRSRKGLEKNFACPEPGCGKSYSRAEHLSRHQLNHAPKNFYHCDHPGCDRTFVRQDLRTRHQERHTARGSHLGRKDNALQRAESVAGGSTVQRPPKHRTENDVYDRTSSSPGSGQLHETYPDNIGPPAPVNGQYPVPGMNLNVNVVTSPNNTVKAIPSKGNYTDDRSYFRQSSLPHAIPRSNALTTVPYDMTPKQHHLNQQIQSRFANGARTEGRVSSGSAYSGSTDSSAFRQSPEQSYNGPLIHPANHRGPSRDIYGADGLTSHNNSSLMPLPSPAYTLTPASVSSSHGPVAKPPSGLNGSDQAPLYEMYGPNGVTAGDTDSEALASSYPLPNWNSEGYGSSPRHTTDDFVNFIFNEAQYSQSASPGGPRQGSMSFGATAFMEDYESLIRDPFVLSNEHGNGQLAQSHPMALNNILDPDSLHAKLSEDKRREILNLIRVHFNESALVSKPKGEMLAGNLDAEGHVLSMPKMQLYIRSYWNHFHPQIPLLHKPTFSADKSQTLLLIALMAIGASCLEPMHGSEVTEAAADLANFLAWNLRIEIFKHEDYLPPAPLWVFQTLLLLELYEKMYSKRILHERAYIFHGPTLDLMRRGTALIGRSNLEPSLSPMDEKTGSSTGAGSQSPVHASSEDYWHRWIANEATRRVAFAAFIIDSIHATMFGHRAHMVAHELKLTLPCDEGLWSAKSGAEVAKKEAELQSQDVKSISFFDGLKNTLKGKHVRTNPLGRMAIMAGLLSMTFMMNQRDVSIHNLGVSKSLGGREMWRKPVTEAFDSWKQSFDASIKQESGTFGYPSSKLDEENIFESRTVLHHLSHMAMHVDIVTCQIFAGAERLLGRTTLPLDYEVAQKRIRNNWAPRASARHATFYALKFLALVLLPNAAVPYASPSAAKSYSARDDFLLNRPWVLYYAMLVVWCYGYAVDGRIENPPHLLTPQERHQDMVRFLTDVGGISAPGDLINVRGRNCCLGLLYVLQTKFEKCRWELLHEAANLLGKCIKKLRGPGS